VVVEAAAAGAHVLCEKPLDVYRERIDRMIEACDDAGVTLAGVFQYRFDPGSRFAREVVDEGRLGDLVLGDTRVKWFRSQDYYDSGAWRGTRDMDGGVLLNQAIHQIDLLQWLMGGVEEVQALTDAVARDLECEDTAAIAVRFESGALGTVEATTATKGGQSDTQLNGTEGSLTIAGGEVTHFEEGVGEAGNYNAETTSPEVDLEAYASEYGTGHDAVVADFVDALLEGREPEVTGREARAAVDLILAAYDSSETGERIEP
jgi:predicted dehydrogenase